MPGTTSNNDLARKIDAMYASMEAYHQGTDKRLLAIETQQQRVVDAIYGNGGPGLKETTRRNVEAIEKLDKSGGEKVGQIQDVVDALAKDHAVCNIRELGPQLEAIRLRHDFEDEQIKEAKTTTLENRRENRKWFLAIALSVATSLALTILDILYHAINIPH